MRRDIVHYYESRLEDVFSAYYKVAYEYFEQDPKAEPFHTITFGLDFSFRYNMNGGACIVRFMRYQNGTAVNVRYAIAQLFGARFRAHDDDMTDNVEKILGVNSYEIEIPVEAFLDPRNQCVYVEQPASQPAPTPQLYPQQQTPQPQMHFCPQCGEKLEGEVNFCPQCGFRLK